MVDKYKSIYGFPNCTNAMNPRIRWDYKQDPVNGVDFYPYKQRMYKVSSESQCDDYDGFFIKSPAKEGGKCYVYDRLLKVCLMVAFKVNPKTSSYYWEYRGGCYSNGEIGVYERAKPGHKYLNNHIPIEVREDSSLFVIASNISSTIRNVISPLLYFISKLSLVLAFVCAFAFLYVWYTTKKEHDMIPEF